MRCRMTLLSPLPVPLIAPDDNVFLAKAKIKNVVSFSISEHIPKIATPSETAKLWRGWGDTRHSSVPPRAPEWESERGAWLPDGYSQILRLYEFGLSVFWTMAPLRYAAKFDPFKSREFKGRDQTLPPGNYGGEKWAYPIQQHMWLPKPRRMDGDLISPFVVVVTS